MAEKKNFLQAAKEKVAQAGEIISDKAEEAKDKAAQAGEIISDKAADAIEKAAQAGDKISDKAIEAMHEYELRKYRPLTVEQLFADTRTMPQMVHIVDWDKRVEEEVCKDAVAFDDGEKGLSVLSILKKNLGLMNVTFYPYAEEGVYYRDPCNPSAYIDLNEYFDYMKKAKLHELNQIAQALGAKHVKITLKAEKKVFVENKAKVGVAVGKKQKAEASHSDSNKQFINLEVASDKKYKGHEARMPELNYFKNEPDIHNIIKRRLDKSNPIYSDVETFKYINSSGIKGSDVAKIDGVLKKLKIGGNASISSEVENEERLFLEYQIEYPEEE